MDVCHGSKPGILKYINFANHLIFFYKSKLSNDSLKVAISTGNLYLFLECQEILTDKYLQNFFIEQMK